MLRAQFMRRPGARTVPVRSLSVWLALTLLAAPSPAAITITNDVR